MELNNYSSGYIALLSTLIIAAMLMVATLMVSTAGFFSRMNAVEGEYKQQSYNLAVACVYMTLESAVINSGTVHTGLLQLDSNNSCSVNSVAVNASTSQISIVTQGSVQGATTILQITFSQTNNSIIKWQELST